MPRETLLCLANSFKRGGRCIAGIRAGQGGWVRPVSDEKDGQLLPRHYVYESGDEPKIFDLFQADLDRPEPEPHQPENWRLGAGKWKLLRRDRKDDILELVRSSLHTDGVLFGTRTKVVDYQQACACPLHASLALVKPERLCFHHTVEHYEQGPRTRMTGMFEVQGLRYTLPITDPIWTRKLGTMEHGTHSIEDFGLSARKILLTISLGDLYEATGCCHKLIAAVIVVPQSWAARI